VLSWEYSVAFLDEDLNLTWTERHANHDEVREDSRRMRGMMGGGLLVLISVFQCMAIRCALGYKRFLVASVCF